MAVRSELEDIGEDVSRIGSLSDGIFAVALTLLVLELRVSESVPGVSLAHQLYLLWPKVFTYFLTFAVVGSYWFGHHRMLRLIVRYDRNLLTRNLLFLALVALLPFPASLFWRSTQTLADFRVAWITYSVNMMLLGLSLFELWRYALVQEMVSDKVTRRLFQYLTMRILIIPAAFLVSIGLSFANVTAAYAIVFLIPVFQGLVYRVFARTIRRTVPA